MSCDIEATIDQRPIDVEVQGAIVAMDLADGDYGDIAVSNNGATMTIENMGENATVTTGTYVSKVNQDLLIKVRKASAGTITKGQAVYIVGSTGNHLTVELARADAEATSAYTIGIACTTITNTSDGFVIQNGRLTGLSTLPTASFSDGDALYLSETTAGGYRVGIPEAPNHGVFLGFVIRANNGNAGELDVRIDNYQELEELSDVYINNETANDFLMRNNTNTRWENTTPANVKTILAINNVDNTSDANKPISTATQTALNAKVNKSGDTMTGALVNSTNGAVSTPPMSLTGSWYSGGTSTNTKPQLLIEPTGTTSTSWSTAGTGLGVNAPSGFTGNFLDLQVNGTPQVRISSTGAIAFQPATTNNLISPTAFANALLLQTDIEPLYVLPCRSAQGSPKFSFCHISNAGRTPGFNISSDHSVNWNNGIDISTGSADLRLFRDAANTLAQRNGTNAQTFRVYNTYTDASNYVRASLSASQTNIALSAETAGTGEDNLDLILAPAGTGTVLIGRSTADGAGTINAGKLQLYSVGVGGALSKTEYVTSASVGGTAHTFSMRNALGTAGSFNTAANNVYNIYTVNPSGTGTNGGDLFNQYNHVKQTTGSAQTMRMTVQRNAFEYAGSSTIYSDVVLSEIKCDVYGGSGNITNLIGMKGSSFFNAGYTGTLTNFKWIQLPDVTGVTASGIVYGIQSSISTAANKWNLYIDGTAQNYLAGGVSIGTTTATSPGELRVSGAATFSGNVTVSAVNLVTDTTTGTKIGTATTQKLGFWNATPVVQPAAVADATDAASVITQLNLLLERMRTLGLIAT